MRYIAISYDDAIKLQNQGDIILVDTSGIQLGKVDNEYGQLWKDNFDQLLIKTPHVPTNIILEHDSRKDFLFKNPLCRLVYLRP